MWSDVRMDVNLLAKSNYERLYTVRIPDSRDCRQKGHLSQSFVHFDKAKEVIAYLKLEEQQELNENES